QSLLSRGDKVLSLEKVSRCENRRRHTSFELASTLPGSAIVDASGAARAEVLVIDDDKDFLLLAEETLTAEGFEVRTAGTLQVGLTVARDSMPDVVVLDRRLPDGDGIGAISKLGVDGRRPLIVIATADGNLDSAALVLRAGADYITKPVALADLVVKL